MTLSSTFNILMYSHDTYGLGHIRRTMAIAEHLNRPDTNILILTGSPMAGRFRFPDRVDYVRIPGMIKKTNDDYFPLAIRIDPGHALNIRKQIILATAQTFLPDLFIVDKEPLGLKKEVLPTLEWIKENLKQTKTVIGLRDVMDDRETVKADWMEKGVYEAMDTLYSEVWVYGEKNLYDPVVEYDIPDAVGEKLYFTGYIPRKIPLEDKVRRLRKRLNAGDGVPLVTVTTGGGGDGYPVIDAYLRMLEAMNAGGIRPCFKSVIVTGPFLSSAQSDSVTERARKNNARIFSFFTDMEVLFAASDLVVCMGGYNTVCEILSQHKAALVIPRETPRKEQWIRARFMKERGLIEYIPWNGISPGQLKEKLLFMLENKQAYLDASVAFNLSGIQTICSRISRFRNLKNGISC